MDQRNILAHGCQTRLIKKNSKAQGEVKFCQKKHNKVLEFIKNFSCINNLYSSVKMIVNET